MASVADYPKLLEDLTALKDAAKIQRELAQARLRDASTKTKSKAGLGGATAAKSPAQAKSVKANAAPAVEAPNVPLQPNPLAALAKALERDPQMESVLRGRQATLGIETEVGRSLGQTLARSIGADRGRGRGMGI